MFRLQGLQGHKPQTTQYLTIYKKYLPDTLTVDIKQLNTNK